MTDSMDFPDIEIYMKNLSTSDLDQWLSSHFTLNESIELKQKQEVRVSLEYQGKIIPTIIVLGSAGKAYTSIWFQSSESPWANDLECARDAFKHIKKEVRCSASGWTEEDGEESETEFWWLIDDSGEKRISWS